jgi:lipopolysaccharide export system permease protein
MKTLDRYIIGIFLSNLMISLVGTVLLFLVQDMFIELVAQTYPTKHVLYYHFLKIPDIIVQLTPPAVLLSTVMTLSGMSRSHELVACYAIGYGLRRIMLFFLAVVVLMGCLVIVMEDRILPPLFKKRTNFYWHVMKNRPDFFLDIKKDKIWYRSKNMIYNLQRFDPTAKVIYGVSLYTFDDAFHLVQVISAERATFSVVGWTLLDGTVTVFSEDSPVPLSKQFASKKVTIQESPKEFQEIEKEVDGLRLKELKQYILKMSQSGANTKSYEVKYYSRFAIGFTSVVMCLLAIPFSVGSRRAGGAAKDLGLCLGVTFIYWMVYSVSLSLGVSGMLNPWVAAWLPSLFFCGLAVFLISKKKQFA